MVYTCPICNKKYTNASDMANCVLADERKAEQEKQTKEAEVNKAKLKAEQISRQIDIKAEESKKLCEEYNELVKKYKLDMPRINVAVRDNKNVGLDEDAADILTNLIFGSVLAQLENEQKENEKKAKRPVADEDLEQELNKLFGKIGF